MSKEQQQLEKTITDARLVLSELRGMQKDLASLVREAKVILGQSANDLISAQLDNGLRVMGDDLRAVQAASTKLIEQRFDEVVASLATNAHNAWLTLGSAMFGKERDPHKVAAFIRIVKTVVTSCGGLHGAIATTEDTFVDSINRLLLGLPTMDVVREGEKPRVLHINPTMPTGDQDDAPHASLQDEPSQLG